MMENIVKAMQQLDRRMAEQAPPAVITFAQFLQIMTCEPARVLRNVFQLFHDMVSAHVSSYTDDYADDSQSLDFRNYDCSQLFVEHADRPFFADRLFASRFIRHVDGMKYGAQQNKIYIFDGPPGCGKSTFLNNLLNRFEAFANRAEGGCHETIWRLDCKALGCPNDLKSYVAPSAAAPAGPHAGQPGMPDAIMAAEPMYAWWNEDYIEIPCPSHDHPLLIIPKAYRRAFLDELFANNEFKWRLFTEKEYEWIFQDLPCTICATLYNALLERLGSPLKVFEMIYARPYAINRRLGQGVSVFNPGDKPTRQFVMTQPQIQHWLNLLFRQGAPVKYQYSRYANTNNGIYALMDIKSHNVERLMELHNIISEGVHKVNELEENVNSLFMALMNPEDKKNVQDIQSFSDRIEYIRIPYVLDINTEVDIYRNIFGRHIDNYFLPRVLHNFARIIIASRLRPTSAAMKQWIGKPQAYARYCDDNLLLLKMEVYAGHLPAWLSEDDRRDFTARQRRRILAESEGEGEKGFSGRDSIKIFNLFLSNYAKDEKLITMSDLCLFCTRVRRDISEALPDGFLDSLLGMYDYMVLQEVKESLYYYNEAQITRDLKNYLFAVNFEPPTTETCNYTGDKLVIDVAFFENIERHLLDSNASDARRLTFRRQTQKTYATRTLTQEIMVDGRALEDTQLYQDLHERYIYNLKQKALEPFIDNENFRKAVKDYAAEAFKTYDRRIQDDVTYLMGNLRDKYRYTEAGAKAVCAYVIDNDLAKKFDKS